MRPPAAVVVVQAGPRDGARDADGGGERRRFDGAGDGCGEGGVDDQGLAAGRDGDEGVIVRGGLDRDGRGGGELLGGGEEARSGGEGAGGVGECARAR